MRELPRISRPLWHFFGRYSARYLARHFHSVRMLQSASPPNELGRPLVVYLNHAAWWDPLVCLLLARTFFAGRPAYAPMAAAALARYGFFKRLGFFPVEGAANFLRTSRAILAQEESVLFLTPQGKFVDPRRPAVFAPGLDHLVAHAPHARFLPLALEYPFWEERKPEVLLAFGQPREDLAGALNATARTLAAAAQRRQPNEWQILLRSKSGVSWPYDFWRWGRARLRGEAFQRDHSQL